jgi:hypothetical protein
VDDHYDPENDLQPEAGYIYANCVLLQLLPCSQAADHTFTTVILPTKGLPQAFGASAD